MSCKVGDKVVVEIGEESEFWGRKGYDLTNIEPLSTYTEPLEAKIKNLKKKLKKWVEKGVNQRAEITRLLEENKRLKAENGNSLWNIEQARAEGAESAWELARKIVRQPINGGYKQSEFEEIFDCGYISDIFEKYTYSEAAAKVEAWEKATIKRGAEVEKNDLRDARFIVTFTNGKLMSGVTQSGLVFSNEKTKDWHKTGRHIDIEGLLKQIGGEE